MQRSLIFFILIGSALLVCGCKSKGTSGPPRVQIDSTQWFVEIADDDLSRYRGLSGKDDLRDDVGMLFVYDKPQVLGFCMRGCNIPIDIAFIDSDMKIVQIYTMQVEPDRAGRINYSSNTPAQYALEVRGGLFRRRGIKAGDEVKFLGNFSKRN